MKDWLIVLSIVWLLAIAGILFLGQKYYLFAMDGRCCILYTQLRCRGYWGLASVIVLKLCRVLSRMGATDPDHGLLTGGCLSCLPCPPLTPFVAHNLLSGGQ